MPAAVYREAAARLMVTDAGLAELIPFVRAHDPTAELQRAWGSDFPARRAALLARADESHAQGTAFAGSPEEVLFCMAHCVASAPYLGTPQEQVEAYLHRLLRELT